VVMDSMTMDHGRKQPVRKVSDPETKAKRIEEYKRAAEAAREQKEKNRAEVG